MPTLLGTIGHVAHGKSTVVKAISGVMTVRFKNELVRNITIKLGYANAKVRRNPDCTWVLTHERSFRVATYRYTSAKMRLAHGRAATGRIALTRRTTHPASGQVAVTA